MSTEFTTDRLIAAWLAGEAPTGAPTGLRDHVVSTTASIRPRPAWLARLKGNHMDVIVGGRSRQRLVPRQLVPILLVVGLLLAIAVGALIVGSQLQKPAPTPTHYALPGPVFQVITSNEGVWSSSYAVGRTTAISRLDESGAWVPVVTDLPTGHTAFVVAGGSIWGAAEFKGGQIIRWDATTGERLSEVVVGDQPLEPLVAFDAVWVPIYRDNRVIRIDPATGESTTIEFPAGGARDLGAGGGRIWVVDPGANWLVGIDATTHATTKTDSTVAQNCGVGYAAERVWALPCGNEDVQVFDPATGEALGFVPTNGGVGEVFEHDGRVWLQVHRDGPDRNVLVNVDPETLEIVGEFDTGLKGGLTIPAFTPDAMWFGVDEEAVRIPLALLSQR